MSYDPADYPDEKKEPELPKKTIMNIRDTYFQKYISNIVKDNNKWEGKEEYDYLFDLRKAYKFAIDLLGQNYPPFEIMTVPMNWKDIVTYKLCIKKMRSLQNQQKQKVKA